MNDKKLYFAPLEGITGYVYRNAYHRHFPDADKYFTPFIVPNSSKGMGPKERRDILPENNQGLCLIPQIMTNSSENFLRCTNELAEYGYDEVNLNLGCPSGTVTAKGRGAGFLAYPDRLQTFLEKIFTGTKSRISIKTRVGMDDPEEFEELLKIYHAFPLAELIIHPRVRNDFYKNQPHLSAYQLAENSCSCPLCYNGDLFTAAAYREFSANHPETSAVMFGRGLIRNPGLLAEISTGKLVDKQVLLAFHEDLYQGYQAKESGARNVLFKMKEVWFYMAHLFDGSDKYAKKIRKANTLADYEITVAQLFGECDCTASPKKQF